jgi:hypothetical protein
MVHLGGPSMADWPLGHQPCLCGKSNLSWDMCFDLDYSGIKYITWTVGISSFRLIWSLFKKSSRSKFISGPSDHWLGFLCAWSKLLAVQALPLSIEGCSGLPQGPSTAYLLSRIGLAYIRGCPWIFGSFFGPLVLILVKYLFPLGRQGQGSGMGHAGDKGYGKTIQYDVEKWGEVPVASHLSVKCTGLSPWKWSWQSPDVVHSPDVRRIVLNCQYSLWSWVLNYRSMSGPIVYCIKQFNITVWNISGELFIVYLSINRGWYIAAWYWTPEGVRWAHRSWILNSGGCPIHSP